MAAVALSGLLAGVVLLSASERDARAALDDSLQQRAQDIARRPPHRDPGGPGGGAPFGSGDPLLAGSDTFVQLAIGGQVVQRRGDVPAGATAPPAADGLATIDIDGERWRSLTQTMPSGVRLQVLSRLAPVEARVATTRRLVLAIGLGALALTGLAASAFTGFALLPLRRLRDGAERIGGPDDLRRPLPDEGPEEVRSLAGALNGMLARLHGSTKATRRFAADAGHELRTPLTGLRANLDALARNPDLPAGERAAVVREMTAEQERIVRLLDGLTALTRGDAADHLPREDVELGDLVDSELIAARRRHPDVAYELREDVLDVSVSGWDGGLRLLVGNLLDNAALHGAARVRATINEIGLVVDDDGPGVPPSERERVLEPFARGVEARAPGTGLGLAIAAQQAALHAGRLSLGDAPLGGLRVEVKLPYAGGRSESEGRSVLGTSSPMRRISAQRS